MRKPAVLERAGALTPRDRIWAAVLIFSTVDSFSVAEIMLLSEQRSDTIISYLRALTKAGYTKVDDTRSWMKRRDLWRWMLVRDIGVQAPRVDKNGKPVTQGIGREQLWRAVRVLKLFTCRELAAAASIETHVVAHDEAKTYVRFLKLAGYVVERRVGNRTQEAQYAFVRSRNTGPNAPLVTRDKCVMDGNTGAIVFNPKEANHAR